MTLKTNISPLEALEIFYEGESFGVWEGDFIKNQKQRNLKLPKLLREFLEKYAYLNVNRGINQLWLPDKIDHDTAKVDGELRDILIIGKLRNNLAAILVDECEQDNPCILCDELPEENGDEITLVFKKSEITLEDYLSIIFTESPVVYDNTMFCDNPEEVKTEIANYDKKVAEHYKTLTELEKTKKCPTRYICWDDEAKDFVVLILNSDRTSLAKITPCFTLLELDNIFNREFYEKSADCDFSHCLRLLEKIIDYFERNDTESPELGKRYQLAGRCCWALKKWQDAEDYYKKAERIYNTELKTITNKVASFYEGLGIFYLDKEDINKSELAYKEADRLAEFSGEEVANLQGNRLMRQAQNFTERRRYQQAVDLYDKALKEFQKDPKKNKYNIARCQQLRGEAKRELKKK